MRKGGGAGRRLGLWLALAPLGLMGLAMATAAEARENYALVVTASDYPNLDPRWWLKGPKNDAALVRDYLLGNAPVKFAPQNVTVLGSGDGMELATHQRILDDLSKLAAEAKADDFVFLQFSGHGSQQPASDDTTEPDGRDEVFLSADTQMAPASNPRFFPNVLTDNEMAAALKAIRKTGAFVWVIFDSCYSGTMTRGAPGDAVVNRAIPPSALGIPDSAFKAAATAPVDGPRTAPLPADVYAEGQNGEGGMVAFFAAQTTEEAPETAYPVTEPDGTTIEQNYGVFTHTIFTALARNPNLTYRQLAQSVLAGYTADNWLKPTPLFEGDLDRQVFGDIGVSPTEQWPVTVSTDATKLSIAAGQLHGLSAGTRLLLLPSPASASSDAIGVMQVASTTELRSIIVPDSDAAHPLIAAANIPAGAYVRLETVTYPFELTVARPDPAGADPAELKAVDDALAAIDATPNKPLKLKLVDPGAPADLRLALLSDAKVASLVHPGVAAAGLDTSEKLWLLPSSGEVSVDPGRHTPAMAVAATSDGTSFQQKLQDSLVTIFRATGLSRLTAASTFGPKDFALSFGLQQAGSGTIAPLAAEETPVIRPNDRLYVDFTNTAGKAIDINVLYIDHDYGITPLCISHLASGDHLFQPFADIEASDSGSERIVAVINESGKDLTDLRFLGQPGLGALRDVGQPGLLGMLDDLGAGRQTRAAPPSTTRDFNTPRGAVVMMPLEALPPTGAAAAADTPVNDPRPFEGECAH